MDGGGCPVGGSPLNFLIFSGHWLVYCILYIPVAILAQAVLAQVLIPELAAAVFRAAVAAVSIVSNLRALMADGGAEVLPGPMVPTWA
eukprot:8788266-Pyramimonas_sp.AAC.1